MDKQPKAPIDSQKSKEPLKPEPKNSNNPRYIRGVAEPTTKK